MLQIPKTVGLKRFLTDLWKEISEDNVFNGAAALAYYLTLAIFPALIALLSLLPFLPISNLDRAILDLMGQAMPAEAAGMLSDTVRELVSDKQGGLLSIGVLAALWAASSGTYAVMQQLNITYDVKEERSFLKGRATAFGLTLLLGALIISAFALIVMGGWLQDWLGRALGGAGWLASLFVAVRWLIIAAALLLAFATAYYFGPNVKQSFRFITPGSIIGVLVLVAASLGFRIYVANFGNYDATYGSIGAVVVLMLWLYVAGLVLLLGSEVNALVEHYHPEGKDKGQKVPSKAA